MFKDLISNVEIENVYQIFIKIIIRLKLGICFAAVLVLKI
jgi:hypothetical protein